MATPKEPLVVVLGTTGTGKSDLAVDLALKFNGEIINADSMQMYKGLPIITNQLSLDEQRGIPHHLLATVEPDKPTWSVEVFTREANRLIREIRSRGKLPIVVGGTHYYLDALLFEGHLISSKRSDDDSTIPYPSNEEIIAQFPILNKPTDLILKRLREVDPVMADKWHPDDRRKISRSLEIFLTTGKRASDIYAQQRHTKTSFEPGDLWQSLMFWVYTDPEILKERLDRRVDKMWKSGLMDEVRTLHESRRLRSEQGEVVDLTRGIWQSIGYKQMEPLLEAEKEETNASKVDKLRETGLEEIKIATRQYARHQLRWIRHKSFPAVADHEAKDHLFLLNSSNAQGFLDDVLEPAANICLGFLNGQTLVKPSEVSSTAKEVLADFENSHATPKAAIKIQTCDLCYMTLLTEEQWEDHLKGRKHKRNLKRRKRTSLICIDPEENPIEKESGILSAPEADVSSGCAINVQAVDGEAIHLPSATG
ncbi:tRNA isopentenyltransferase [Jackrogersella minutella]|nr:tRNA isopentenyltransferase [Jackrogersella minutella]